MPFEPELIHTRRRDETHRALLRRAYELRANVASYDACYVALAEALDCPLYTADRRLANATGPRCEMRMPSTG